MKNTAPFTLIGFILSKNINGFSISFSLLSSSLEFSDC